MLLFNMEKFIEREITKKAKELLLEKQILVITGMRRVGKTTLIKYLYNRIDTDNKIYLNLENAFNRKIFEETNYDNIKLALEQEGINFSNKSYIFIDEIQFLPNLPSILKYLYDKFSIKFVVTGSTSYYLKNHFTESLAGRKFIIELFPLTFKEFLRFKDENRKEVKIFTEKAQQGSKTSQEKYEDLYQEYIKYGGFPEVVLNPKREIKEELLKDILNSYFQIDVTTIADFQDIKVLKDLLTLLTQRIGQKINITNLANVLDITREKVYEYLQLLDSTYVISSISQKSSIDNQISANDKFYFTDTGLANVLSDIGTRNQFENSIFMNLVGKYDLTFYQSNSKKEIDFILDKKIGLEVKVTPDKSDLHNLKRRAKHAGLEEYFLVGRNYTGTDRSIMAWDL